MLPKFVAKPCVSGVARVNLIKSNLVIVALDYHRFRCRDVTASHGGRLSARNIYHYQCKPTRSELICDICHLGINMSRRINIYSIWALEK